MAGPLGRHLVFDVQGRDPRFLELPDAAHDVDRVAVSGFAVADDGDVHRVDDFARAFAFYSTVLPELGLELMFKEPENGWAGWMMPGVARPLFLVGLPFNRQPASPKREASKQRRAAAANCSAALCFSPAANQ